MSLVMQPEIYKERVKKYGSFLWCPERSISCFGIDTPDGTCKHRVCLLEDPRYLAEQKKIAENIRRNAEREKAEREKEKMDPPAPIRKQNKTRAEILRAKIKEKERLAERLYAQNRPDKAEDVIFEIKQLSYQLKQEER